MNKVISFKRGTSVQIHVEPNCDPLCSNYSDKHLEQYDQKNKIIEIRVPVQTITDPQFIIITNQTPVNTTLTVKQLDNDTIKMEIITGHRIFLMDKYYLIVPTDIGFEIYDITTNTKLCSINNGFLLDEQNMFNTVRKFYDKHVFVISNNTHWKILILSEDFTVFDEILINKTDQQLILYTAHWINNILIFKDTSNLFNYYDVCGKNIFYKTPHVFGGWLTENIFIETTHDENKIMLTTVKVIYDNID